METLGVFAILAVLAMNPLNARTIGARAARALAEQTATAIQEARIGIARASAPLLAQLMGAFAALQVAALIIAVLIEKYFVSAEDEGKGAFRLVAGVVTVGFGWVCARAIMQLEYGTPGPNYHAFRVRPLRSGLEMQIVGLANVAALTLQMALVGSRGLGYLAVLLFAANMGVLWGYCQLTSLGIRKSVGIAERVSQIAAKFTVSRLGESMRDLANAMGNIQILNEEEWAPKLPLIPRKIGELVVPFYMAVIALGPSVKIVAYVGATYLMMCIGVWYAAGRLNLRPWLEACSDRLAKWLLILCPGLALVQLVWELSVPESFKTGLSGGWSSFWAWVGGWWDGTNAWIGYHPWGTCLLAWFVGFVIFLIGLGAALATAKPNIEGSWIKRARSGAVGMMVAIMLLGTAISLYGIAALLVTDKNGWTPFTRKPVAAATKPAPARAATHAAPPTPTGTVVMPQLNVKARPPTAQPAAPRAQATQQHGGESPAQRRADEEFKAALRSAEASANE